MIKVTFKVSDDESSSFSAKDVPVGRAFAFKHRSGSKYIKLADDVFLCESQNIFRAKDFDGGDTAHYILLPRGTTVTITT